MTKNSNLIIVLRLSQVMVACIPLVIGLLALLNNISGFSETVNTVIKPLISMPGNTSYGWRALPLGLAPYVFTAMFIAESLVGFFALAGVISMLRNINKDAATFNARKSFVYLACGWGIFVWGLCFFEIGGDWFLAWQNSKLSDFQSGAVMYVEVLVAVLIYLS